MNGRVVVVGGGVIGTMHALRAASCGFEVVQLEKDLVPREASVRNFGLIWVGGRAAGPELRLALRARRLWEETSRLIEGLSFRAAGSLTVALDEAELSLMEQACRSDDAQDRAWELLDAKQAWRANPELSTSVLGALYCGTDAILEPRAALGALRRHLLRQPGYRLLVGRTVIDLGAGSVRDDTGEQHSGDKVFVCTGAALGGLVRRYSGEQKLRRVRLQMLETAPCSGRLTTALADGGSMRYYPAFDLPGRDLLRPQDEVAESARAQLLLVQRLDGSLTIGDTHDYDEPFSFDLDEPVYDHLLRQASRLLRQPLPPVRSRWAGVYSEVLPRARMRDARDRQDEQELYWRQELAPGVELVSGTGGRGMSCAPAIAEDSFLAFLGGGPGRTADGPSDRSAAQR